jgi:hypothetical protein
MQHELRVSGDRVVQTLDRRQSIEFNILAGSKRSSEKGKSKEVPIVSDSMNGVTPKVERSTTQMWREQMEEQVERRKTKAKSAYSAINKGVIGRSLLKLSGSERVLIRPSLNDGERNQYDIKKNNKKGIYESNDNSKIRAEYRINEKIRRWMGTEAIKEHISEYSEILVDNAQEMDKAARRIRERDLSMMDDLQKVKSLMGRDDNTSYEDYEDAIKILKRAKLASENDGNIKKLAKASDRIKNITSKVLYNAINAIKNKVDRWVIKKDIQAIDTHFANREEVADALQSVASKAIVFANAGITRTGAPSTSGAHI